MNCMLYNNNSAIQSNSYDCRNNHVSHETWHQKVTSCCYHTVNTKQSASVVLHINTVR